MCSRLISFNPSFMRNGKDVKVPLVRGRRFTAVRAAAVSSVSSRWKVTQSCCSIATASSAQRRSFGSELIRLFSLRSHLHLSSSPQRQAINKHFGCQRLLSAPMIEITVENATGKLLCQRQTQNYRWCSGADSQERMRSLMTRWDKQTHNQDK